jgi:predicted metal-dependent RNase
MNSTLEPQLIHFLQQELELSADAVAIATSHRDHTYQLPMILWQYGLITLQQLDQIFEWLATYQVT